MKKIYLTPATKVQKIELQSMIAVSGPQNVYSDEANGISNENSILSRESFGGLWDDEE